MNSNKKMVDIINLLKNTGFVFQGSEIYGGLANTWDYGPLGSVLIQNIKNEWLKYFIHSNPSAYLIDSKILMNPNVWIASGHVGNFSDPLIENKINKKRYRADHIIEELFPDLDPSKMSFNEMENVLKQVTKYDNSSVDWTPIRQFNLMFETYQGVLVDSKNKIYLRPETAQGIFINFKNIVRSMRPKLPFVVGQIGKSFRNEVTPGNFIFRTREFEQMEMEIFVHPTQDESIYNEYIQKSKDFLLHLGLREQSLKIREHDQEELAHYSKGTTDIEFQFPFGFGELMGIANRSNFDLKTHMEHSKENLEFQDPITNEKLIPFVIEPSIGVDRLALAILVDAFEEEQLENDTRTVLKLNQNIAPYQIAVLPLVKKLAEPAKEIFQQLIKNNIRATYTETGSIGKRYRQHDAIGTYYCLTFDHNSLEDNMVTLRNRDTMQQERIAIKDIWKFLK